MNAQSASFLLPSISDLIFIVLLLAFTFGPLAQRLLWDADIGWHIRNGENILATRSIPHVDSFSATMRGRTWFAWEWLYDAIVGWIHRKSGLNGVVFLAALTIASTLALVFRITIRRGANLGIAVLFFVLCALASSIHFLARPHVVGWLLTIICFLILDRHDRERVSNRFLFCLPLLIMPWANLHGGFVLGLVLLGIFFLAGLLEFSRPRSAELRKSSAKVITLGSVFAFSLFASLINPYGYKLYVHIYQYLTNNFFMHHIDEFRRPDLHKGPAQAFLLMMALTVLAIVLARARLRWTEWLLILFSATSGMYAARNLPVASMLLMMIAAPLLSAQLRFKTPKFVRWGELLDRARDAELRLQCHLWPLVVVAVSALICFNSGALFGRTVMNAHFDPARFPVQAVNALQRRSNRNPIFSLDSWGGYFIYGLYPETAVFIDDRHDFYGEPYIREYLKVIHVEPGWESVLDGERVNLIVMPSKSKISDVLRKSANWKESYEDTISTVFERRM